jgi:hypothetical protein
VATEIARKLVEQGEQVVHLFLIDPPLVTSRLHRLFWALTERWGDLLNWDLEKKITCFDRYFVPLDRWLKRSPSSKLVSIGRRLGLVKAEASEPGTRADGEVDNGDGAILKSLDYAFYVLAYRLYTFKRLAIPTAIYFPEETPPSPQSSQRAREIFPLATAEMVPGNHRTCIIKYTVPLVEKMKKNLG